MPKCLVCNNSPASTTRRDITYHMFPKNEYQRREWLKVYGIDHCNDSHRICSDHFLKENYRTGRKRYLKKDTIPQGYDKNCFLSNCTQSNDVVMSNNAFLPTELNRLSYITQSNDVVMRKNEFLPKEFNCLSYTTQSNDGETSTNPFLPRQENHLSYTTQSNDGETSTNPFLPREENHLRKVQSYENMTRLKTEPFETQNPTCTANDNIQTVIESVSTPVLTTTKYKQEATSTFKMPDKLSSNTVINPELKTPVISECFSLAEQTDTHDFNTDSKANIIQCIIIDDDDTEDFTVNDHRFIYNISKIIVLPSALWRSVYDCVQNTTSFYKRDSFFKTEKKIIFYNNLIPKIQIYGMDYKYNKPIKSKNELQSILQTVDSI
ncbi:uncharacterized protein LOC132946837 isoform X2 [Metopolophium dirhodum]|uniref:uncharacterized protein LOC132946837 isoform X2 n=1 Tax=Metopolophium dirhodum TaxID=44670 RepID=UPI00298F5447|nr:uncharacterized protein LOC132946837 isoform X2 [Metopolophium dirhodum]